MLRTFRASESYEDSLNSSVQVEENRALYLTERNNKNNFVLEKIENKKRILLLVDTYDWCFFNIATQIKKEFTQYTIDILSTVDFYNNMKKIMKNPYNIYLYFFPDYNFNGAQLQYIQNIGKYKYNKKSSIFWCMYDNFTWRIKTDYNTHRHDLLRKNMARWMNNADGYFWGSPKIRDNIYDTFTIIKPNASCMDGVDTRMFNYKDYDEDILTKKKLKIGWIGNSNVNQSGLQKGYREIKQYVCDLSDNFEFCPLDREINLIPHNKVPDYIHNIDIIVCYSTCEGTPNQILEGSSCGRCWISTDVGIVSSVYNTIEDNPTGIIIKKNEKAFKDALLKLYENRNLIVEYGKNGRKAIEKKWDWKYRLEGFKRVFQQF